MRRHHFDSDAVRRESQRLAMEYDNEVHTVGIASMVVKRKWRDLVLEWLATLALGDPGWDRKIPFYGGPRTNWGKSLVESKLRLMEKRISRLSGGPVGREDSILRNEIPQSSVGERRQNKLQEGSTVPSDAHGDEGTTQPMQRVEQKTESCDRDADEGLKRKRDAGTFSDEPVTRRMKLSITKWRKAKAKDKRLNSTTDVIELDRVAAEAQDTWTIANLHSVYSWDERGVQAVTLAKASPAKLRRRQMKRSVAQVWRGKPDEVPKNLSLVTRGKLNGKEVSLVFDTAAQVTVISKDVWEKLGSPEFTPLRARATAADGASMKLMGALKLDITVGNKTFPYRVWVIDGLRSDVLLGLDFMDVYPTIIDTGRRLVAVQGEAIPIKMMDWDQTHRERQRRPVRVSTLFAVSIPAKSGRELPVRVTTEIPLKWRSRVLLFTPAQSFGDTLGLEVASVIIDGSQNSFYVRVGNFTDKPVGVDVGLLIGQLTPLARSHMIRQLVVPEGQCEDDCVPKTPTDNEVVDFVSIPENGGRFDAPCSQGEEKKSENLLVNESNGLLSKFLLRDPRPVPAACGMESERGGRTSSDLKSIEPEGSPDGCVTHRAGGMQQPEEPNLDLTDGGLFGASLRKPEELQEGSVEKATPACLRSAGGCASSTSRRVAGEERNVLKSPKMAENLNPYGRKKLIVSWLTWKAE